MATWVIEVTEVKSEVSLNLGGCLEARTAKNKTDRYPPMDRCLSGILVRASDIGSEVQGLNPASGKGIFFLLNNTKEIEVIKKHRPICQGPSLCCRSMGPLPSCIT